LTLHDPSGDKLDQLPFAIRRFQHVFQKLTLGCLTLTLPNRHVLTVQGTLPGPNGVLHMHRWRVLRRAGLRGDVGLGDAFMDRDWDTPGLPRLLEYFAVNTAANGTQFTPTGLAGWILAAYHNLRANSPRMARRHVAAHYDLGNQFYATWLDPSMTYSAALFSDEATSLEDAQIEKYRALVTATGIEHGSRVLEIGCGWGEFACFAAEECGCHVTAVTLSPAQRSYAEDRVARSGLTDKVTIVETDYRSISGQYDHVVSIEIIEAVGEQYWPTYFEKVASLLKPGGKFGLQAITIRDSDFDEYRKRPDFLQTYIFPGGMLLPQSGMHELAGGAGLTTRQTHRFGQDYARTLAIWLSQFEAAWPEIETQGFDGRFNRMWRFYLAMCEAGFRSGLIDVSQTVYERP